MELKLSQTAVSMLFRMFFQPATLQDDKPYQAKDAIATQDVYNISRWLSDRVFTKVNEGTEQERFVFKAWTGKLKQNYVKRIKEVVEHYKKSGSSIENLTAFVELKAALDNRPPEIESVEEMEGDGEESTQVQDSKPAESKPVESEPVESEPKPKDKKAKDK